MEALPQLALLAVAAGLVTGMVTLLFRIVIDFVLGHWILPGDPEAFEQLPYLTRLLLPAGGALAIGLALTRLAASDRRVGVVHVMERLGGHQGHLPVRNAMVQFFGGIVALVTGQSGGREGPAVHLGAASASLLGQAFNLPNNSVRTLVGCGTAAAIAGSFNTPLAGVIFALEVVMMDYAIASFIPVIISAVTATLMTHYFIGDEAAFVVAPLDMRSLVEIPFIIAAGVVVGCLASAFIATVQAFARLAHWPFWLRALLAGAITGLAAITVPEVMGIGYDTVNAAMLGQITLTTLLLVVVFKSLTSAAAVGLGLPVGLIGPTFVIGAAVGGALGYAGALIGPDEQISVGFYVMLGMTAMMAAVLQAPLAALVAVTELTANPNLTLPAMLIIVVACLVTNVVFRQRSVFLSTLDTLGLKYPPDPVTLHLQRAGITSIMSREFARLPQRCDPPSAREALAGEPRWIVVETEPGEVRCLLNAADLHRAVDALDSRAPDAAESEPADVSEADAAVIDLLAVPGERRDVANLDYRATIAEAHELLKLQAVEALCVRRTTAPLIESVVGVVTWQDIDKYRDNDA